MGEYAQYNGQEVKIGTCSTMYYLRVEDVSKVFCIPGNVDPVRDTGLFFRIPFPDEDLCGPGGYNDYNRGLRLVNKNGDYTPAWLEDAASGTVQLHHALGLLVNVPCHHGVKLPDLGAAGVFWNGKTHHLELAHVKRHTDGLLYPVVRCRACGDMWRTDWEEILPYVFDDELHARLQQYQARGG